MTIILPSVQSFYGLSNNMAEKEQVDSCRKIMKRRKQYQFRTIILFGSPCIQNLKTYILIPSPSDKVVVKGLQVSAGAEEYTTHGVHLNIRLTFVSAGRNLNKGKVTKLRFYFFYKNLFTAPPPIIHK